MVLWVFLQPKKPDPSAVCLACHTQGRFSWEDLHWKCRSKFSRGMDFKDMSTSTCHNILLYHLKNTTRYFLCKSRLNITHHSCLKFKITIFIYIHILKNNFAASTDTDTNTWLSAANPQWCWHIQMSCKTTPFTLWIVPLGAPNQRYRTTCLTDTVSITRTLCQQARVPDSRTEDLALCAKLQD